MFRFSARGASPYQWSTTRGSADEPLATLPAGGDAEANDEVVAPQGASDGRRELKAGGVSADHLLTRWPEQATKNTWSLMPGGTGPTETGSHARGIWSTPHVRSHVVATSLEPWGPTRPTSANVVPECWPQRFVCVGQSVLAQSVGVLSVGHEHRPKFGAPSMNIGRFGPESATLWPISSASNVDPTYSRCRPRSTKHLAQFRLRLVRARPNTINICGAQRRLELLGVCALGPEMCNVWPDLCRTKPELDQLWLWPDFGRICPERSQLRSPMSRFGQAGPNSSKVAPMSWATWGGGTMIIM